MAAESLRFLLDENIPSALFRFLQESGHDVVRVTPTASDPDIATQAKLENRILVTLDNDFSNRLMFPPKKLTIILIRIHPPDKNELREAMRKLLKAVPRPRGLVLLERNGPTTVSD